MGFAAVYSHRPGHYMRYLALLFWKSTATVTKYTSRIAGVPMAFIEWYKKYELGIKELDEHH